MTHSSGEVRPRISDSPVNFRDTRFLMRRYAAAQISLIQAAGVARCWGSGTNAVHGGREAAAYFTRLSGVVVMHERDGRGRRLVCWKHKKNPAPVSPLGLVGESVASLQIDRESSDNRARMMSSSNRNMQRWSFFGRAPYISRRLYRVPG